MFDMVELTSIEGFTGFLLFAPAALIQVRLLWCTAFATAVPTYQVVPSRFVFFPFMRSWSESPVNLWILWRKERLQNEHAPLHVVRIIHRALGFKQTFIDSGMDKVLDRIPARSAKGKCTIELRPGCSKRACVQFAPVVFQPYVSTRGKLPLEANKLVDVSKFLPNMVRGTRWLSKWMS